MDAQPTFSWRFVARVLVKAAALFALCNLIFAAVFPMHALGRLSLYNTLFPGRERLPYAENTAEAYSVSVNNVEALLASHVISRPKANDEFRVVVLGDSGVWGWFLENDATLTGQLNTADLRTADGRHIVAYNLGYPILSVTKDLLLLDAVLDYEPDLIIWPVTLDAFPRERQLLPPLVQHNPGRVRRLISSHDLQLDAQSDQFIEAGFWERTIVGQRRPLADLLRLQLYGVAWAATGIDQAIPEEIELRASDFEADIGWQSFEDPAELTSANLAFEVLEAGVTQAGNVPVIIINEPIFISSGVNSGLRYNAWYPRWAYTTYRQKLAAAAASNGWTYIDLWDSLPAAEFTDSPVHLTAHGNELLAAEVIPFITNR